MAVVKSPNSKQLLAQLEKGACDTVYLFLGEEESEKDKAAARIAEILFKGSPKEEQAISRFYVQNDEFMAGADFALASMMFSSKKVCIIKNINELKSPKQYLPVITELLENLPDGTVLIMTSPENKAPSCIPAALLSHVTTVQFWRPFESELTTTIMARCRTAGVTIEYDAVNKILALIGRDAGKTDAAIERIIDSGKKTVTARDVSELISYQKEVNVYEFADAFFKKKKTSLALLKTLIDDGVPELLILSAIVRQAEQIDSYHALRAQGLMHDEALAKLHVAPKGADDFSAYIKSIEPDMIRKIFMDAYSADAALKSDFRKAGTSLASHPLTGMTQHVLFSTGLAAR